MVLLSKPFHILAPMTGARCAVVGVLRNDILMIIGGPRTTASMWYFDTSSATYRPLDTEDIFHHVDYFDYRLQKISIRYVSDDCEPQDSSEMMRSIVHGVVMDRATGPEILKSLKDLGAPIEEWKVVHRYTGGYSFYHQGNERYFESFMKSMDV